MEEEEGACEVFCCDPAPIDLECFALWVEGVDALSAAQKSFGLIDKEVDRNRIVAATDSQFRSFSLLKHHLRHPGTWAAQSIFQVSEDVRLELLTRYYDLSTVLLRRIAGRKLRSVLKKEMDQIGEEAGEPAQKFLTQYNNCRRIWRAIQETNVPPLAVIGDKFSLPVDLARRYVCLFFLSFHRLDVSRRPLTDLSYDSIESMAGELASHWTHVTRGGKSFALDEALVTTLRDTLSQLSKSSLADLRKKVSAGLGDSAPPLPHTELLPLPTAGRQVAQRRASLSAEPATPVRAAPSPVGAELLAQRVKIETSPRSDAFAVAGGSIAEPRLAEVRDRLPSILRAVLQIGGNIVHAKEVRDFFIDVNEKVSVPLVQHAGLSFEELCHFFNVLYYAIASLVAPDKHIFIYHYIVVVKSCTSTIGIGIPVHEPT